MSFSSARRSLSAIPPHEFAPWLTRFLARLPTTNSDAWLPIGVVTDRTDGKLALAAVTGEHYAGGHWLGSFATYLTTRRGIAQ